VLLKGGFNSCAELKVFPVTVAERKHVKRCAQFQQLDASCQHVFLLQGKGPKEIYAVLAESLGEQAPIVCVVGQEPVTNFGDLLQV
jgi:hypothetical protein